MRIYLDVCCLNWPFDDQTQHKIYIETVAIKIIFSRAYNEDWVIISSDVIDYEISKITDFQRRNFVELISSIYESKVNLNEEIIQLAKKLNHLRIEGIDALHISCASFARQMFFLQQMAIC